MIELLLVFIFGLFCGMCWMFILSMPSETAPIMMGQIWQIDGLGKVTILKVAPSGGTLPGEGKGFDILYQMSDGRAGYCKKIEVWKSGKLMHSPDRQLKEKEKSGSKKNSNEKQSDNARWMPNQSGDYVDVDYWSETAIANRAKIKKTYY